MSQHICPKRLVITGSCKKENRIPAANSNLRCVYSTTIFFSGTHELKTVENTEKHKPHDDNQ